MQTIIQLSAQDNMTQPATTKAVKALGDLYECLTGTSEQELANEIFEMMRKLEDIGFNQYEHGQEEARRA